MPKLSNSENRRIRGVSRNIIQYKRMLAQGYQRLASKTDEASTKHLLSDISAQESDDAKTWAQLNHGLGDSKTTFQNDRLLQLRVVLMMGLLGSRGFMEWTLIALDESIESLMVIAGNIQDVEASERWLRITSDERLHIERMKKEILGMESWEMGGGGGVRDVVFGANDGLVSILALVAGVFGAVENSHFVLLTGIAGAIAGTVSMGAGAYISSKSEQEVTQKEQQRKGLRKKQSPEEEFDELVQFYQDQGFERSRAEAIAQRVAAKMDDTKALTIGEETGLTTEQDWPPTKAGLLTGLSFFVASLIPILPFAILPIIPAAITAGIASLIFLFFIGASKAIFTRQNWVRSGLEVLVIGTLAAAVTYIIGQLFPEA